MTIRKELLPALVLVGLLLSGCAGGKPQPSGPGDTPASQTQATSAPKAVTLQFWYSLSGTSGQAVEALVRRFNESHPGIVVNATYQGAYAEIMAKVWNAIYAEQTLPDVAQLGGGPLVGNTGAALPVTDWTDKPNGFDRASVYDSFWQYNSSGGKIWSMPFNNSVPVLYYNKDLFTKAGLDPDKPPETWADVLRCAQRLSKDTDGNGSVDQWGFNTYDDTHWYLSAMFLENGARIVNDQQTEVLYNSTEAVEMLTLWGDMVNEYEVMPPAQHKEAQSDFIAGKLGMLLRTSAVLPSLQKEVPFKLGVAKVPVVAGKKRVLPLGGGSLVVFNKKDAALVSATWEFVRFMTNKESSLFLSTETGYLPIYKDALEWPEMKAYLEKNPAFRVPIEELADSYAIPVFSSLGTSDSALRQAIEAVELGAKKPQDALNDAKAVVDQDIKDSAAKQP